MPERTADAETWPSLHSFQNKFQPLLIAGIATGDEQGKIERSGMKKGSGEGCKKMKISRTFGSLRLDNAELFQGCGLPLERLTAGFSNAKL